VFRMLALGGPHGGLPWVSSKPECLRQRDVRIASSRPSEYSAAVLCNTVGDGIRANATELARQISTEQGKILGLSIPQYSM
jgi:hypothetical protein